MSIVGIMSMDTLWLKICHGKTSHKTFVVHTRIRGDIRRHGGTRERRTEELILEFIYIVKKVTMVVDGYRALFKRLEKHTRLALELWMVLFELSYLESCWVHELGFEQEMDEFGE